MTQILLGQALRGGIDVKGRGATFQIGQKFLSEQPHSATYRLPYGLPVYTDSSVDRMIHSLK